MRPRTRGCLISLLTLGMLAPLATAQPICFQAVPFVDVFTLTTAVESLTPLRVSIPYATMEAPGLYQLGGAGVVFISALEPIGQYALRVPMANASAFFGGNADCALNATISPSTLTGSWRLTCAGTTNPFTVPGTLAEVSCSGVFSVAAPLRSIDEVLTAMHTHGQFAAGEESSNDWVE